MTGQEQALATHDRLNAAAAVMGGYVGRVIGDDMLAEMARAMSAACGGEVRVKATRETPGTICAEVALDGDVYALTLDGGTSVPIGAANGS